MKLLKNPVLQGLVLVLAGGIIGAWGWDKHESTLAERTSGSVFMMVVGAAALVAGLLIWFTAGNRSSK